MPCTIEGIPLSIKGRIYREERKTDSPGTMDDNTDTIDTANLASACKSISEQCERTGYRGTKTIRNCHHIPTSIVKTISDHSIDSVRKNYDPISSNNNIRDKLTIHRIGYYYKMFVEEGRYSAGKRDWERYCKENK